MTARRFFSFGGLFCVFLTFSAACAESSGPPPAPPTVSTVDGGADPATGDVRYVALGDSISQGIGTDAFETDAFPSRLSVKWRAKGCKVDLNNLGIAGYTASDVIAHELPQLAALKPTFITLQDGTNDILNGIPIETYRTNLRIILDAAKKTGARVIVLPENEWFRSPEAVNWGTQSSLSDQRAAFDAVLIAEVKAKGAEFVDLRALYKQHADRKLWAADGVHPTPAAYDEMATEIARVIPAPCGK